MRIGELAELAAVPAGTIRYYESIELLDEPGRTASGYRDYSDADLERLRFIREAKASGLTLAEVASVLELKDSGEGSCEHTRALLARHIDDIDQQLEALTRARAQLVSLSQRADSLDPALCTDPHRCQVISTAGDEIT